jgi:hypothetical protein
MFAVSPVARTILTARVLCVVTVAEVFAQRLRVARSSVHTAVASLSLETDERVLGELFPPTFMSSNLINSFLFSGLRLLKALSDATTTPISPRLDFKALGIAFNSAAGDTLRSAINKLANARVLNRIDYENVGWYSPFVCTAYRNIYPQHA